MKITCTETTTTEYDVTPAEGWTRSDLVLALDQGRASVRGSAVVAEDGKQAATIARTSPETKIAWR